MNIPTKRKDMQKDDIKAKKAKIECMHGEKCYRKNPKHFMEFSHRHLEAILDLHKGKGPFTIPEKYSMDEYNIVEQLEVIVEKQLYRPTNNPEVCGLDRLSNSAKVADGASSSTTKPTPITKPQEKPNTHKTHNLPGTTIWNTPKSPEDQQDSAKKITSPRDSSKLQDNPRNSPKLQDMAGSSSSSHGIKCYSILLKETKDNPPKQEVQRHSLKPQDNQRNSPKPQDYQRSSPKAPEHQRNSTKNVESQPSSYKTEEKKKDANYRPVVPPTRRVEDYLNVVVPKGKMAAKHAASAPYHIFYTTITAAKETHQQQYSITFQEILDRSLGELKCSLQINFMVEIAWLLAQYYFAGYSEKKLTILYGEECSDLKNINNKKPQVDAHLVQMATPFGKHHTKMMVLCYEDGSLRVVVSTANLYVDDWENRTQGLWFSPRCPELPPAAMPHDGESPTMFKRALLRYLSHYHNPFLSTYVERVKRCDFSHINVFLVASAPGSHFDTDWGMTRMGSLLRQHCAIPASDNRHWPLLAQASSIGSYGKEPNLWLTGDFLHQFTKIKDQPQMLSTRPQLKLIYPSLENVQQSHDGLLGGGCLPYAASAHIKQPWLNDYLFQWRANSTRRDRAMPHIKSYTRVSPDNKSAAYFLLTSGNVSKAAWGSINKGNSALRIMSYEAGVLFLPRFIINEDLFPLSESSKNRLILPYDVPPTKYTKEMSPWVSDYLC